LPGRALIVFAKQPEAGQVKTRLCPPLTNEEAKELYTCFLKDALRQYRRCAKRTQFAIHLFVTPPGAIKFFETFVGSLEGMKRDEVLIAEQSGADLGERMRNAFDSVLMTHPHAVIIGSDHPTLPDRFVEDAFDALDTHDAAIGPTLDGGYYLLGLKAAHAEVFSGISWSTEEVFSATMKKLDRLRVARLPEWYDVDDEGSLNRLIRELRQKRLPNVPEYTEHFISEKFKF